MQRKSQQLRNDKLASHSTTYSCGVKKYKNSILIYWYGDEWLNGLFEQNRIRIKHEPVESLDYDRRVLTASTDELQKFIKKYANNPITVEEIEQIFSKGSTDGQSD